MKWEPLAAMLALILLGAWLVGSHAVWHDLRPGAETVPLRVGDVRGALEVVRAPDAQPTYRLLYRNAEPSPVLTHQQITQRFGPEVIDAALRNAGNPLFRLFNITGWLGLLWVGVGFAGQAAFFGRMALQWVVSEKQKDSVVPEAFWWLSLVGGAALFTYFVWRQDLVGVLGQSTGVVIYARNLRLIHKRRRREQRRAQKQRHKQQPTSPHADPAPEPTTTEPDPEATDREKPPIRTPG